MITYINSERVKRVADTLRRVPIQAIDVIEANDPQYTAVKKILRVCDECGIALVIANALVSYRLSTTGEKYWLEFASFVESQGCEGTVYSVMEKFLQQTRSNRMMQGQKLSRIKKVDTLLQAICANPHNYRDLQVLVSSLARSLNAKPIEKTIVFAAKMAYYAFKSINIEAENIDQIPIPVDRRVALLTSTSGLVDASPELIFQRLREKAAYAWQKVSEISRIPSINLDAIIWLPARSIERYLRIGIEAARDEYAKKLVDYSKGLISWKLANDIAKEILYKDPFAKRPRM